MNKKINFVFKTFLSVFILIILLVPLLSKAAFFDPKLKWQTLQTPHFNIHFHEGEETLSLRVADIAERVYSELTPKLNNWKPWGRTEVVLTDHTDISNAFATTFPYNYLLLYVSSPEGTSALNYYDDWLEELFTHEFTHILHIDQYGGIAKPFRWVLGKVVTPNGVSPGWVREGIAVYEESQKGKGRNHNSFSDMMLRTDILNDEFLAIDEAAGQKIHWPSAFAPYIYGGAFWQYLSDTYGADKIAEFMKRYGDSMWLFSLNNKARKTFDDKNFLKLWSEWKSSLKQKYEKQNNELQSKGLTSLETLVKLDGNIAAPTLSPDGKKIIYSKTDVDGPAQIRLYDLEQKRDELISKGRSTDQFSFSKDGKKVVFGSIGVKKRYYIFNDLYEIDLETKKMAPLTTALRASQPDYSPDGKSVVFVKTELGSSQLALFDLESKKEKVFTQAPAFTRFSNPRFSPDGKSIVVSAWMHSNRDLYLYNLEGNKIAQLTHDKAIENEPSFSADGKSIYYTSDASGISNIYRMNLDSHRSEMISNVNTGVFYPQKNSNSSQIITQHYFGRGYDIVSFAEPAISASGKIDGAQTKRAKKRRGDPAGRPQSEPRGQARWIYKTDGSTPSSSISEKGNEGASNPETQTSVSGSNDYKIEKYNPFKKLFIPRYIMPNFVYGPGTTILSASTGSSDPLGRHIWSGDIHYRTDSKFLGGDFFYTYNRWRTPFFIGYNDYVLNYGDIFRINQKFLEEHRRVFAGIRIPEGSHKLDFYYAYERRLDESNLPGVFSPFLNLGNFGGLGMSYTFNRATKYPGSISPEGGPHFNLTLEINDHALGSGERNETKIVEGDLRYYLKIPGTKHHVFALRAAGGYNFGDKLFQGVFRLGSALGEGTLAEKTPRLYTLRGLPEITFAGDGALLFSGEYRLPLVNVERGITTMPIFLKQLSMAFFADYGTVFTTSPKWDQFLLGVGAELRGDFSIGYGFPLSARLGYGIIVKGRQFLGGLTDPLLGSSIKNGTLILQLGTSF